MMIGDVMEARSRRLGLQRGNSVGRAVFLSKSRVVAFYRTKICPTRNAGDWDADVVEVGRQDSAHEHSQTQRLPF